MDFVKVEFVETVFSSLKQSSGFCSVTGSITLELLFIFF